MRGYQLKPNHRTQTPGALVTVDTESYEVPSPVVDNLKTYPLRLGVARFVRIEAGQATRTASFRFTTVTEFWDWLRSKMSKHRITWLFAHNLGWDLAVLRFWDELANKRFTLEGPYRKVKDPKTGKWAPQRSPGLLVTKDPPSFFKVWDSREFTLKGCDLFNWLPSSLASLAPSVGMKKTEFPGVNGTDADLWPYCENDCAIAEALVLDLFAFVRKHNLGNFRYTPAAQSLSIYQHWKQPAPITFHCCNGLGEFERRSYFGGRRAVFFRGEVRSPTYFRLESDRKSQKWAPIVENGPVTSLDVTAAYPAQMRDNAFPVEFCKDDGPLKPVRARELLSVYAGCAWVDITSLSEPYPVRTKQSVFWYTGTFQTALCGPELVRALDSGHVTWVHQLKLYRSGKPFKPFCDGLLEIEQQYPRETAPGRRALTKILRNALHGKFGQRNVRWETLPGFRASFPWGQYAVPAETEKGWEWRRSIARQVQRLVETPMCKHSFPLIAGYCTAYCRERMRHLVELAGPLGCYYVDADTMHVSATGLQRLIRAGEVDPSAPGKLRILETVDHAIYFAPKHYLWGDKLIISGVPRTAQLLKGGRYRVQKFSRMEYYCTRQPPVGGVVTVEEMAAPVHQLGARVTPSGWTLPLVYASSQAQDRYA